MKKKIPKIQGEKGGFSRLGEKFPRFLGVSRIETTGPVHEIFAVLYDAFVPNPTETKKSD